jgi:hypothetical protein
MVQVLTMISGYLVGHNINYALKPTPLDHEGAPVLSKTRIPNIKADHHDFKIPPFVPILSQTNPIHTLPTYSLRSHVCYANCINMNIKPFKIALDSKLGPRSRVIIQKCTRTVIYEFNNVASFYVHVTVHRESKVETEPARCNSSDVYSQIFISKCFGHHYAHHQENRTVYYRTWCSVLIVLAVVVWSWAASRVHCVKAIVQQLSYRA